MHVYIETAYTCSSQYINLLNINKYYLFKTMSVPGRVFIYGGKGALGGACVSHYKSKNWVNIYLFIQSNMLNIRYLFSTISMLAANYILVYLFEM